MPGPITDKLGIYARLGNEIGWKGADCEALGSKVRKGIVQRPQSPEFDDVVIACSDIGTIVVLVGISIRP